MNVKSSLGQNVTASQIDTNVNLYTDDVQLNKETLCTLAKVGLLDATAMVLQGLTLKFASSFPRGWRSESEQDELNVKSGLRD